MCGLACDSVVEGGVRITDVWVGMWWEVVCVSVMPAVMTSTTGRPLMAHGPCRCTGRSRIMESIGVWRQVGHGLCCL